MARAGITFIDVIKAAESIRSAGQDPTVDRVREHLKTGSKSTIAPLLKRWRSEEGDGIEVAGLPNDLVETIKSLYERMQQLADVRIEQARQEHQAMKEALLNEQKEARRSNEQLTTRQQELTQQNRHLTEEKQVLVKSLEDMRLSLAKVESQRDTAMARVADLATAVAELKQENRDVRNHFEHYQERIAEDRQQEREQFRTNQRQLQDQLQVQTHHVTQLEARTAQLHRANEELRSKVDEQKLAEQINQIDLTNSRADIQRINKELAASLMANQNLNLQIEQLRSKTAEQSSHQALSEKTIALLKQSLQKAESELQVASAKMDTLTDEAKVALQEKAILLGQLKQMQNSMQ